MINTINNSIRYLGTIIFWLLILVLVSTKANAQDTLNITIPIEKDGTLTMLGVEVGLPIMGRGFINPNITLPQRITDEYYIIHYIAGGYSFKKDKQDEYVFSYGIGIPLYTFKKGVLYGYLIDAYHYRPKKVVVNHPDHPLHRDFRQRRVKLAYRKNSFEFSTTYTIRYSLIFGASYHLTIKNRNNKYDKHNK